jgi:phosphatidylcholine synthase
LPPLLPWVAHLYTATGAILAFAATLAIFNGDFRSAFLALIAATFVDATDGWLARAVHVKERVPQYDGARLDDIVDYLTYVFVPVLLLWRAGLLPEPGGLWVAGAVLIASAYGFGQADAKVATTDHFFTGFPSYWNVLALYLYLLRPSPETTALVLIAFSILVFVPIRYIYPSRTRTLFIPTMVLGTMWAVLIGTLIWRLPATDGPWLMLSLVFPVYYVALSLWLNFKRQSLDTSGTLAP